ncbi:MAG: WD40 repeat domain-containing protein [Planctomycetota bacterium]|nr:WD40 repeat domain-containing protein [Planctomycetota bacterium]
MRTLSALTVAVVLVCFCVPGAPCEEQSDYAPLEVSQSIGGPSPQVAGSILSLHGLENGNVVAFCRYPEGVYFFSPSSSKPVRSFNVGLRAPLITIPTENAFVCPVPADEDGFYRLVKYSLKDGSVVSESRNYSGELHQILYSRSQDCLITASNSGHLRILGTDLSEKQVLAKFSGIFSLDINKSGSKLVFYSPDKRSKLFDLQTGDLLAESEESALQLVELFEGTKAVVNTFGSGLFLYDLADGTRLFDFPGSVKVRDIEMSQDSKKLFVSYIGGKVEVFDMSGEEPALVDERHTQFEGGPFLVMTDEHLITYSDSFVDFYNLQGMSPVYKTEPPRISS